jgi:serine/threonine-protein kinase
MSNCPECGEQIAEADVFCSYCGITLTPVAPAAPEAEDPSMSATIVGLPSDMPAPAPVAEPVAPPLPPAIPSPFATPVPGDPFAVTELPPEEAVQVLQEPLPAESPAADAPVDEAETTPVIAENPVAELANAPVPQVILDLEAENFGAGVPVAIAAPVPESEMPQAAPTPFVAPEPERIAASDVREAPPVPEMVASGLAASDNIPESGDIGVAAPDSEPKAEATVPVAEGTPVAPEFAAVDAEPPEIPAEPLAVREEPLSEDVPAAPVSESLPETSATADSPGGPAFSTEAPVAATPGPVPIQHSISDEPAAPDEIRDDLKHSESDQDSIETLETRVPDLDESTAPGPVAAETPVSSGDVRPSTKPNIGNGDTDGRRAAKLKPLEEGKILNNRYEIVRKIGGGGMGAVYLANDRNLGGILRAVKEMVQSYIESEQQEKAIQDFQREAMILTNLEHPAIPTIYDYFYDEKEGRFYLVMKYISGGDLAGRLRANPEGRLDEKTVTEWAVQVADVLDYLHRQDPVIVYRDLKPANIMIDGNTGRLMLIDFGIARSINKEEKGVTAVGTMGYAPPELFSGNVEPRSDIYSLGSTMFHLLTGADPQSNPLLIFDFQKNPRPRQINPQLSDQIEQILMRAVEYNADSRFRSAAELKGALEDHLLSLQSGKVSYGVKAVPSAVGFSEQLVFCGFCGKQIVASDVFCAFCGSQQPIAQQSFHQAPVLAAPSATAKLYVVLTNDLESAGFTLEKDENLIGRRDPMSNIFPEVDLSKFDPQTKISRRHARIRREGTNFLLEDLGSSNGTIVTTGGDSARLLPHQPRLLTNGDRFRVGDTTLQFAYA